MEKTVQIFQKSYIFKDKTVKWLRNLVDILITKSVLNRYKAGYGFVIGVHPKLILSKVLPLTARMQDDLTQITKNNSNPNNIFNIRNNLAKKNSMIPSIYMNDRVLMNIEQVYPKSLQELWAVDGISDEFVIKYGSEFLEQFLKETKKTQPKKLWTIEDDIWLINNFQKSIDTICKHFDRTKGSINLRFKQMKDPSHSAYSRLEKHYGKVNFDEIIKSVSIVVSPPKQKTLDTIYGLYRQGNSIKQIISITNLKPRTVEEKLINMLEKYDVDIELDYFGITEETENQVAEAVKKVGLEFLKPIKDQIKGNVSYTQIKVCLLVMRIEKEEI
jgi:hypothetical protein